MFASLQSIGSYIPSIEIPNEYWEKRVDTNSEWIMQRTGIKTRFFAKEDENTSDLAFYAAQVAIKRAKIEISEIDMVIVATLSPDCLAMPSTACILAGKLGILDKPAFDISSACSGFVYLLSIAKAYIESGMAKKILIVGSEKISSILNPNDRGTCILFGDGAGAAIIGQTNDENLRILDVQISSNGSHNDVLTTFWQKNKDIDSTDKIERPFLEMKGNETFKLAVKTLAHDANTILSKNNLKASDIKYFIPHQANLRIINAVAELTDFKSEQLVITLDKFGNTSSASIPMAMDMLYKESRLKKGDKILLDAFGGGVTWGSAILTYAGE